MTLAIMLSDGSASDIDAVMSVMDTAFDPQFGEAWNRGQAGGMLGLPGVRLMIARNDSIMAGFALGRVVLDEAELLLLAVMPPLRRTGIATALLKAIAARAHADGARRLHLEMRGGNPAEALYRNAGFATIGHRPAYYRGNDGSNHDAISLSLALFGKDQHHL